MNETAVESSAKLVLDLNKKIRVLHVDDDSCLLKITKQCLESEAPLHVETAVSVEEALNKLEKETFDVVVSDYQMPGKDGLDFLKTLRSNGNTIPFIMFTGKGTEEVAIKALNLGANQYLNKLGETGTAYAELARSITELAKIKKEGEALRDSEEKYRALVEQSLQGIVVAQGTEPHIVFANAAMSKILGYASEKLRSLLPEQIITLIHPEDRELFFRRFKDRLEGKLVPTDYEVRAIRKNGTVAWLELSSAKIEYNGQPAVQATFIDVTDRKKTEEELKESEEKYRELFESIQDPVSIYVGKEGLLDDYNRAFKRFFGYTDEELKGKVFLDFVHPDDQAMVLQKYQTRYPAEEFPIVYEIRVTNKKGESIPLEISVSTYKRKGKVIGIEVVHRDIKERKRYEENLFALNTHGRDLNMAKSVEEVYELTLDAMRKTLGFEYTRFMIIEKNNLVIACHRGHTRPVVPNLQIDGTRGITVRAIRTREPVLVQDVSKDRDYVGSLSGIQSELAVPVLAEDRVLGVLDVESRKLAAFSEKDVTLLQILASHAATAISNLLQRKEIEKRSNHMASLMKSSAEMIHTADLRHRLRTIAEAIREFGWRRVVISVRDENLEMRSPDDLVAVGVTDEEREFLWKNRPPGHMVRERLGPDYERFKIGEFYYIPWNDPWVKEKYGYETSVSSHLKPEEMVDWHPQDTVYAPLRLADGRIVGRLSMDDPVDGRRPTKETLMPLELFLHQAAVAIENAQLIQQLADARTRAEAYAQEMRESQQKFERLFMDNPEAAVHLDSSFHILNVNPRFSRLFDYSLDEVKGRHINDVIVPKDKMEEAVAFDERASKGELYHEDTIRKRKDGSLVPVAFSAAAIIVENQIKGHIAVYKDISQLKKSEDELREMLQKLDKMNEKLRVVGGLTRHDVRNKLSTITGNAYLLKKQLAGNSELLDKLEDMEKAVKQTVRILDFARAYEMLGAEELVYTDVEKTVNEAISLFTSRNNIEVINDCHGLIALADSLLRQLFYNLIDNSLKYGQKTSRIRVYYEKAGQGSLRLVYEDDGVGIPVADKPKLFKEGYSTGGSTGHGLYLIKKMMEAYGWTIQETGEPSKGARFVMTIPETNSNGKENCRVVQ
jgi:PAS domain S-box-containing protein